MPATTPSLPLHLDWIGAAAGPAADAATFSRALRLSAAGKPELDASSAPAFRGDAARWNPEELLLAAVSSCHCLTWLYLCARKGIQVASYSDDGEAVLGQSGTTLAITAAILRPRVRLAAGDGALARSLHALAHEQCFIARSVNFPITIEDEILA